MAGDDRFGWPSPFDHLIEGHGPVHHNRERIVQMRNYIEELTGRVERGKKAGRPLAELQKTLTVASIKTLQANGYSSYLKDNMEKFAVYLGQKTALEDRLSRNIEAIYDNLDRV
jgi:type II secretory pathway component PulF